MEKLAREDLILTAPFSVTSADTDMYTRLRPGALVNFLIQASIQSADSLGYGFKGLSKHQLFWVLSRLTVEVYRPLRWYESLSVETWAKDVEKLIYLRDYIVRDGQNEVVARGTSGWLAIDYATKRPKRLEGSASEIFEQLKGRNSLEYSPEKICHPQNGVVHDIHPSYFDFDLNKHVTSTRYVDWMMDTFSFEFHQDHYPRLLSVNYMREVRPGEGIRLTRSEGPDNHYIFEGLNVAADKPSFRGRIDFGAARE